MNGEADARRTLDVAALPPMAFGNQGLIWWGTVGFMVIEGSMFVIGLVVYFYLRLQVRDWPPSLPNPGLRFGTWNLLVVLASCVPNLFAKKAAEKFDLAGVRAWLGVLVLMGVVSVGLRALEYTTLNCRWDDNAYGSIVWCCSACTPFTSPPMSSTAACSSRWRAPARSRKAGSRTSARTRCTGISSSPGGFRST